MASSSSLPSSDDCSSTQQPPSPLDSQCGIVDSPINGPYTSASASTLPWLWVIQAVSCCKEIDISTLQELIDVAPVAKDDFCDKTRDLIALRCLEDLFGHAYRIHVVDGVYGSLDPRPGFDFSRSCEDVLQQILDKKPLSNLKEVGAEFLKWDIFPFIVHKRATVKSDFEQCIVNVLQERMAGAKLDASLMASEDVILENLSGGLLETRSVLSTILSSDPSPELRKICRQLLACITSS